MGEQSDTPGGSKPSAPYDLDIPVGRKPRPQHEFVAAVEQRAALQGGKANRGTGSRARRKSNWLVPTIIGVLVVAAVLAVVYVFMSVDGQQSEAPNQSAGIAVDDIVVTEDEEGAGSDTGEAMPTAESDKAETETETAVTPDETQSSQDDTGIVLYQDDGTADEEGSDVEQSAVEEVVTETTDGHETVQTETGAGTNESAEAGLVETVTVVPPEPAEPPPSTEVEAAATEVEVAETAAAAVQTTEVETAAELLPIRAASAHSGARVQLAAYGTEQRAQDGWQELEPELGDIMGDHVAVIEEADVDTGIFYRLQIGYFDSGLAARDFCDAVLTRRLDCIVVPD